VVAVRGDDHIRSIQEGSPSYSKFGTNMR